MDDAFIKEHLHAWAQKNYKSTSERAILEWLFGVLTKDERNKVLHAGHSWSEMENFPWVRKQISELMKEGRKR